MLYEPIIFLPSLFESLCCSRYLLTDLLIKTSLPFVLSLEVLVNQCLSAILNCLQVGNERDVQEHVLFECQ